MKQFYFLLAAFLITISTFAQAPEKLSYQAIVRDSSENLVKNQAVGMQISILQGVTVVYTEVHTQTTNINGLITLEIGTGTAVNEIFSAIDWKAGTYFIKTETDLEGGTNYTITGTSQLLSVPFALHAKTAESITGTILEIDPVYSVSQAQKITETDIINLGNLSKVNTGDQDISGIAFNTIDIFALKNEQIVQNTAIVINTDKIGITSAQASEIKANTNKTGITSGQVSVITENTEKVGYTEALVSANTNVVANTAKTGITSAQATAIVDNTSRIGITTEQASAITTNTSKYGYTCKQKHLFPKSFLG